MQLNLNHISYTYPESPEAVLADVSVTFPNRWTAIVGDSGCGKTTLARIACHLFEPNIGTVAPRLFSVYCQQDSSIAQTELVEFAGDWSSGRQRDGRCAGGRPASEGEGRTAHMHMMRWVPDNNPRAAFGCIDVSKH